MQQAIITVIYSHGKNGSPWHGTKIKALRPIVLKMGMNIISIDYSEDLSIEQMEEKLINKVKNVKNVPGNLIFLSSSRGAYISINSTLRISKLFAEEPTKYIKNEMLPKRKILGQFLIAPALYSKPEDYPNQNPTPPNDILSTIVHGYDDEVIDYRNSIKFAQKHKAALHLIEGDHRMTHQIDKISTVFQDCLYDCTLRSNLLFSNFKDKAGANDI